jgi:hypothetical protein
MDKWRDQLAEQPANVCRVAADAMAVVCLPIASRPPWSLTSGRISLGNRNPGVEGDPLPRLRAAFAREIGHQGIYYLTGSPWQVAFDLAFARRVLDGEADPYDAAACTLLAD